jgi:hypothetical protein
MQDENDRLTDLERYHVDNRLNLDRGIHRDKVVVNKDKIFESPRK